MAPRTNSLPLKSKGQGKVQTRQSSKEEVKGWIASVRRLAIHDGPGIRTIVFLKGCPLRCSWCAAPETQSLHKDLLYYPEHCLSCNRCAEVCSEGAITVSPTGRRTLDRSHCNLCGRCVEECFSEALRFIGEEMTVGQVMDQVKRDHIFYQNSGGGVTISGGEPLHQVKFTRALLHGCRSAGIHTALETTGFQTWKLFSQVLKDLDLLLYDLKHMDPEKHRKLTGVSNDLILDNLKKALATGVRTIIRVPVITGLNDEDENLVAMGLFLKEIGPIEQVDLLPYHRLGEEMYHRMERTYDLQDLPLKTAAELEHMAGLLGRAGLKVQITG
jgi:pyruvate formate lyase activating enzyme